MSLLDLLPLEWRAGIAAGGLLLALGGLGGGAAYLHHRWYGEGYGAGAAAATAQYQKLMVDQAAANQKAIDATYSALLDTADDLSKKNMELDDALAQVDKNAGAPGGDAIGLDARRVRDLGAIQ